MVRCHFLYMQLHYSFQTKADSILLGFCEALRRAQTPFTLLSQKTWKHHLGVVSKMW